MKKTILFLIGIIIATLLIGCGGGGDNSDSGKGSLEIRVLNGSEVLDNVQVIIEGKKTYKNETDKDGIVFFNNIESGNYRISITNYSITKDIYVKKDTVTLSEINVNENIAKYTFLFYANSYNLDSGLIKSLKEMFSVGSDDNVNIVVLYKLSNDIVWKGKVIKNEETDITKGLTQLPNQNFGRSETLEDFIIWAKNEYPAEHYILDLWDHGSGWDPNYDYKAINHENQIFNKDYLSIFELFNATYGKGIEYLCFDACSMQFIEVLTQIKDCFEIITATENIIPSTSYDYKLFFKALKSYNDFKSAMIYFGKEMLNDEYWKQFNTDFQVTDLSKIDSLNETIKSLADYLYKTKDENQLKIFESSNELNTVYGYGKDLGSFVTNLNNKISNYELKNIVRQYKLCEKEALIFNGKRDLTTGFLVNLPTKAQYNSYFARYNESEFSRITNWDIFLKNRIK